MSTDTALSTDTAPVLQHEDADVLTPAVSLSAFVRVPRAHVDHYAHLPWPEVVSLATAGVDGLSLQAPGTRRAEWTPGASDYGFAYLRCDPKWAPDKTVLYQQNW